MWPKNVIIQILQRLHYLISILDKASIYSLAGVNNISDEFVLSKLNKRIELATTLSVIGPQASENYQVANYGIGGQYAAHCDPHELYPNKINDPNFIVHGDRFATFMAYLSDVPAGGGTAFPLLGRVGKSLKFKDCR